MLDIDTGSLQMQLNHIKPNYTNRTICQPTHRTMPQQQPQQQQQQQQQPQEEEEEDQQLQL